MLLFIWLFFHQLEAATFTVGSGTPESCTFAALKTAWDSLDSSNVGSTIQFNCGTPTDCNDEITITLTETLYINYPITIDGGVTSGNTQYKIILDSQNLYRHFVVGFESEFHWGIRGQYHFGNYVWYSTSFTLKNIILINGRTPVGTNSLQMGYRPNFGSPVNGRWVKKGDGGCLYVGKFYAFLRHESGISLYKFSIQHQSHIFNRLHISFTKCVKNVHCLCKSSI